jgi:hypothetical protein
LLSNLKAFFRECGLKTCANIFIQTPFFFHRLFSRQHGDALGYCFGKSFNLDSIIEFYEITSETARLSAECLIARQFLAGGKT